MGHSLVTSSLPSAPITATNGRSEANGQKLRCPVCDLVIPYQPGVLNRKMGIPDQHLCQKCGASYPVTLTAGGPSADLDTYVQRLMDQML